MKKLIVFLLLIFLTSNVAMGTNNEVDLIELLDYNGKETSGDFKVIAQGNYSEVDKPFIFVARNEETYLKLNSLGIELPESITPDFSTNAVVAVFAGFRPTGGWSVSISRKLNTLTATISAPPKDRMVTQVETAPYKIFLIPISEFEPIRLEATSPFESNINAFRVEKAKFEFFGGIAGIRNDFTAEGVIRILRFKTLITLIFDLSGTADNSKRRLSETASGTIKRWKGVSQPS